MFWVSHGYGIRATQRLPQMPILCVMILAFRFYRNIEMGSVFSYSTHKQFHGAEF